MEPHSVHHLNFDFGNCGICWLFWRGNLKTTVAPKESESFMSPLTSLYLYSKESCLVSHLCEWLQKNELFARQWISFSCNPWFHIYSFQENTPAKKKWVKTIYNNFILLVWWLGIETYIILKREEKGQTILKGKVSRIHC